MSELPRHREWEAGTFELKCWWPLPGDGSVVLQAKSDRLGLTSENLHELGAIVEAIAAFRDDVGRALDLEPDGDG